MRLCLIQTKSGGNIYTGFIHEGSKIKISASIPKFNKNTGTFGDDLREEEISRSMSLVDKFVVVGSGATPSRGDYGCVWHMGSNGASWNWGVDAYGDLSCRVSTYYYAYVKEPEEWRKWYDGLFEK